MRKHFIRNRKVRFGGIAAVLTALVIAVTVLANAIFSTLADRYGWHSSMLTPVNYDVTDGCYTLLDGFFEEHSDAKVEIIFCSKEKVLMTQDQTAILYQTAKSLTERYSEHLTLTCYDIRSNPTHVKQYMTTLDPLTGETVPTNLNDASVIFVSEGYHRVYAWNEFYAFDAKDSSSMWGFNGEKKFSAGIMRAVEKDAPVACLTTNHGEAFYDYELLYLLDDAGYMLSFLDLYKDPIPEECELLISFNPNTDLVDDEISQTSELEKLESFLAVDGHSYLVFMENGTPSLPNFERYLAEWGVAFNYHTDVATGNSYRYMVQDTSRALTADGYTIYGDAVTTGTSAQITAGVRPGRVVFQNATAMRADPSYQNIGDGSYQKGNRTLHALYQGGSNAVSWANGNPVSRDRALLATLTEQTNGDATSYVGVFASANFSTGEYLQSAVYANADAMLGLLRYCGRENVPQGLPVKPFLSQNISSITTAQMLAWTITLAVTPAVLVSAIAIVVLVRRRRS